MKTQHTPGQWKLETTTQRMHVVWIGDDYYITFPSNFGESHIRLIAAAPELLAAAENLENDNGAIPEHAWNMLQAAIKKARGEA